MSSATSTTIKKPPLTIHPTALLATTATLSGTHPISIGANAVIHPRVTILSSHAAVHIGESCILNERAVVGLKSSVASTSIDGGDGDGGGSGVVRTGDGKDKGKGQGQEEGEDREAIGRPDEVVRLGKGVLVEGKASVEGVVGDWSIVGVGATVQRGAKVEEHCQISPLCNIRPYEEIPLHTIIFGDGSNQRRQENPGLKWRREVAVEKQIEAIRAAGVK